jgi:BlaI family transcriptional regulator, penicillinase repressor
MARPQTDGLTDYELEIMQVIWRQPGLKVAEILEALSKDPKPAYTSLLTIVKNMEKKGYVEHEEEGRSHRFFAKLKQNEYKTSELKKFVDRFFGGSPMALAMNIVKDEDLDSQQIAEIKDALEEL